MDYRVHAGVCRVLLSVPSYGAIDAMLAVVLALVGLFLGPTFAAEGIALYPFPAVFLHHGMWYNDPS